MVASTVTWAFREALEILNSSNLMKKLSPLHNEIVQVEFDCRVLIISPSHFTHAIDSDSALTYPSTSLFDESGEGGIWAENQQVLKFLTSLVSSSSCC